MNRHTLVMEKRRKKKEFKYSHNSTRKDEKKNFKLHLASSIARGQRRREKTFSNCRTMTTYRLKVDCSPARSSSLLMEKRQVDLDEQRGCIHQSNASIFERKVKATASLTTHCSCSPANATHRDICVLNRVQFRQAGRR